MPTDVTLVRDPVYAALVNPKTAPIPGVGALRRWSKSSDVCNGAHLVPFIFEPTQFVPAGGQINFPQYGYTHLLTGNPVRAMQDDCRHHLVGYMIDNKGFCRPLTCSGMDQGPFQGSRYNVGEWFVAEASNPVLNNGFALTDGYTYGQTAIENPETYLMQWDSHWGGGRQQ